MIKLLTSWGADINYAFGTMLAAILGMPRLLDVLVKRSPYGVPVVFLALFWVLPPLQANLARFENIPSRLEALESLRSLSGNILVNTEGGHLFLSGKPGRNVTFFDGIESQLLEQTGLWDSRNSALAVDIRHRRFDRLVLHGDFLPAGVHQAAGLFYDPRPTTEGFTIYTPKSASAIAVALSPEASEGQGGVTAAGLSGQSLHVETEGYAPKDRNLPGLLSIKGRTDKAFTRLEAAFSLRVSPDEPAAGACWSVVDASGREVMAQKVADKGLSRRTISLPMDGRDFELRIVLSGNAWIVPVHGALAAVYVYP